MKRIFAVLVALIGCSEGEQVENQADTSVADTSVAQEVVTPDSASQEVPELPRFPPARQGRMVVSSNGETDLASIAPARAGVCANPPMAMIHSEAPPTAVGRNSPWSVLLLLAVPPAGERETEYEVVNVAGGLPDPPASQIAFQLYQGESGRAFQGLEGHAEVYVYGEVISGRFQIVVRDINTQELVSVAGSFEGIQLVDLPANRCNLAAGVNPTVDQ